MARVGMGGGLSIWLDLLARLKSASRLADHHQLVFPDDFTSRFCRLVVSNNGRETLPTYSSTAC